MEINFSSKVYSKSLLKVESLKESVVYSLILDYQFCACIMRVSGVPQLQVIQMVISDTSCMIDVFTIAFLTTKFGQVWAEYVCHDVTPQMWRKSEGKLSI